MDKTLIKLAVLLAAALAALLLLTSFEPEARSAVCGDGSCDPGETADSCPQDCAGGGPLMSCGDGVCQEWELTESHPGYCPGDCGEDYPDRCGDGVCQEWETYKSMGLYCEEDCAKAERCATYIRYGVPEEHCAVCGDGVCDPFERCVSSDIGEGYGTDDCGGLYCPEDCE